MSTVDPTTTELNPIVAKTMTLNLASADTIVKKALVNALAEAMPRTIVEVAYLPTDDTGYMWPIIQPYGFQQTLETAHLQIRTMKRAYSTLAADIDVAVVHGMLEDLHDVAVIVMDYQGRSVAIKSAPVAVPIWVVAEFDNLPRDKFPAIGSIVHKRLPDVDENDWQSIVDGAPTREEQIRGALVAGFKLLFPKG